MKIAICQPYLHVYGGGEKVLLKIAQKFDATIYCLGYEPEKTFPEFKELDVRVIKPKPTVLSGLSKKRMFGAAKAAWAFYNLKLDDYDVVNAHGVPSEWARNRNSPMVWYNHGLSRELYDLAKIRRKAHTLPGRIAHRTFSSVYKLVEKDLVKKIEFVFANSEFTRKNLEQTLGIKSEVLHPRAEYDNLKSESYEKYFLVISRIGPEKGQHRAIEAFKKFSERSNKKWKLVIVGGFGDGGPAQEQYLKQLKLAGGENVEFVLNASESKKLKLLSNCYALVFPALREPFGIAPLEAMGSHKPVLVFEDCGGPRETVVEGKNGFICKDAGDMAEKMVWLAENPGEVERMGFFGRKHVEKNFAWDGFLEVFEKRCRETAKQ